MSPLRIIILGVAALAAVFAAFLVRAVASGSTTPVSDTLSPVIQTVEVETQQEKVLVAIEDIPIGTLLTPEHFSWANWPKDSVNPDYFTEENDIDAIETLTGSVVRVALYTDEPILPQKVVKKGETGFMAALLPAGKRATAVEISPESASAGFILPDDRVDIILTQQVEIPTDTGTEDQTVTTTIIENVRILAIDQTFSNVDGASTLTGSTATMELDPKQSEMMALAARTGTISLALRSVADATFNNGEARSMVDIATDVNAGNSVRIYRGGQSGAGGN